MKRSWCRVLAPALLAALSAVFALPASAQPPKSAPVKPKSRQVQGKIIRVDKGQFVVETRDKARHTFRVRPQTKFRLKDRVVPFTDLRVGRNVTVDTVLVGEQPFADSVVLLEEDAVSPEDTLLEGEIVRVIGTDQVVVRTPARKEVIVFVDPRTTFLLENRAARFTDLRVGHHVRARVHVRGGRHMARQIMVPPRRR
jgi:hypothetical protein